MPSSGADLAVRATRILTTAGWRAGTIVARAGRIVDVLPEGAPPPVDLDMIDAGERVVLPGLVDTHAHFRDPGFTDKEDWHTGSRAAALGGVTFVADMPNVEPPPTTLERFLAHRDNAAGKSIIDFGHNVSGTIPEEIPRLAEAGVLAFKVFMMRDIGRSYPHMPGIAVEDHADLYRICEAIAATGRVLMVHAHDGALAELLAARRIERDGRDPRAYARAYRDGDGVVIDSGIATILAIQRATGVRLHILHVNTIGGLAMIRAAKADGRPVTAETNPFHHFVVNDWATIERDGPLALGQWVPEEHAAATWDALLDGTIDVIASDHTPHTLAEKQSGWTDMFATPGGSPTIQHGLALFLDAVHHGRIPLERVVEAWSTRPAELFGLAPRKGSIAVGADADLVLVDLDEPYTIRNEDVASKCGWTVLDGRTVIGRPVTTISRGRIVADRGVVLADPGSGRFVGT